MTGEFDALYLRHFGSECEALREEPRAIRAGEVLQGVRRLFLLDSR